MGAGSAKLTPLKSSIVGDKPLLEVGDGAVGEDGKVTLKIREATDKVSVQYLFGAGTGEGALTSSYGSSDGQLIVTQIRNHMPHNSVSPEYVGNLPFTGAVPAEALVHFLDAHGKTVAVLMNGANDVRGVTGVTQCEVESTFTHVPAVGYRNGEGASVLFAATPGRGDAFFDNIPTKTAAAVGLTGKACAVCMSEFNADEQVKELPCGHAFRPACIQSWLSQHNTCPLCRKESVLTGGVVVRDGTLIHGGEVLKPIAQIKCVLSEKQKCARGVDYRYKGGLGLYPIGSDGKAAAECALMMDGGRVMAGKAKVAKLKEAFGESSTPKLELAAGLDPVLVLALASEWDANRCGVSVAPVEGALGG